MLTKDEAFRLSKFSFEDLAESAGAMRDEFSKHFISYSPNVLLPLTHLCRDTCSYCSFAQSPDDLQSPYMPLEEIRSICEKGVTNLCGEALFTLGESPESRYEQASTWLTAHGYSSTIDYLVRASSTALLDYGLLPHVNPGAISDRELRALKEVSVSQGMMLESIARRLSEPGGPHFGAPDKTPARRLATLEAAGRAQVPFTTGVLVGIGDTRHERIEGLLALRDLNDRYGHIQEVIVQNFLPKPMTAMAFEPACTDEEHLWSIAAARLIMENTTHIQAPPNLVSSATELVRAGADDFGGISPVSIDCVNPERPWPHLETLTKELLTVGRKLRARTAIYPEYIHKHGFVAQHLKSFIANIVDSNGYMRKSPMYTGASNSTRESISRETQENDVLDLTQDERKVAQTKTGRKLRESNFPTSRPV